MKKRSSGEETTPGQATPADLCSAENHGHHLQKEKAVIANTYIAYASMANPVNVSKSKEDVFRLT